MPLAEAKARTDVQVGDEIYFMPNDFRGGHGAYCIVTKVKRRTFDATEREGSYRAGKLWNIHMTTDFHYMVRQEDGRILPTRTA